MGSSSLIRVSTSLNCSRLNRDIEGVAGDLSKIRKTKVSSGNSGERKQNKERSEPPRLVASGPRRMCWMVPSTPSCSSEVVRLGELRQM